MRTQVGISNYADVRGSVMPREIINQSTAARNRGVSRQRISELYKQGRFSVPMDDNGTKIKGALYLDEVENLTVLKRGRPKLTEQQRTERCLDIFKTGDAVMWKHSPRNGYGFIINITARVEKVGASRLLLSFKNGEDKPETAWANRSRCTLLTRPK